MNMFEPPSNFKKKMPLKANNVIKTVIYSGKPNRDVNKLQGG